MKEETKHKKEDVMAEVEKKEENFISKIKKNHLFMPVLILIGILAIIFFLMFMEINSSRVYIENSYIYAPIISIVPDTPGILEKVFVTEGDEVSKSKIVAIVGNRTLQPKTHGIVVSVKNTPGQYVTAQDAIVKIIDPKELIIIGKVDEDKGLKDIKPGQKVEFTVDAFESKKYYGIVEVITSTARQSDIVFSISDKREAKQFEIRVKFNPESYPELKNGMSAKMWIYK